MSTTKDPILAAIKEHQRLDEAWLELDRVGVSEDDVQRAFDAAEDAAWEMAHTKPTTVAGAAALLEYVTVGPTTGLLNAGETLWHETALRTVVESLAEITRAAPRAA